MTSQPHDALFKATFEQPTHAAGLFRHALPRELVDAIDWETFDLEAGSFVDDELAQFHTDLLFSARAGDQPVLLYVLLEHQSRSDPRMPFRVLAYIVQAWRRHLSTHGDPLPLMLGLVISHDPAGWSTPVELHDLILPTPQSLASVAQLVPGFRILVEDLCRMSNAQLQSMQLAASAKLALWLLRDARNASRLLENIGEWAATITDILHARDGAEVVVRMFRYIAFVCTDLHVQEFRETILEHLPETERTAMTMAEELIQEGLQKGRQEGLQAGLQAGRQDLLTKLLNQRFGPVPAELQQRIDTANEPQIQRYAERLLLAETLEAVFEDS